MPAARHARRGLSIGAVALLSLWIPLLVNGLEAPRREHEQDGGDKPPKGSDGTQKGAMGDTTGWGKTGGSCPNADDVMLSGGKGDDEGCIKCANIDDSPYAFVNHMSCFKGTPTNGYEPQVGIFCSRPIWSCNVNGLWHPGTCLEDGYKEGEMLFELVGRAKGDCGTFRVHRNDMADLEPLPPPTMPIEPHDFRPFNNDSADDDDDALEDLYMGLGIGGGFILAGVIGICGYIAVNRRTEKVEPAKASVISSQAQGAPSHSPSWEPESFQAAPMQGIPLSNNGLNYPNDGSTYASMANGQYILVRPNVAQQSSPVQQQFMRVQSNGTPWVQQPEVPVMQAIDQQFIMVQQNGQQQQQQQQQQNGSPLMQPMNQFVRVNSNGQLQPYDGQLVRVHSQGDGAAPYVVGTHGTTPIFSHVSGMIGGMGTMVQGTVVNGPSSGGSGEGVLWPGSAPLNAGTDSGNTGQEGSGTVVDLNRNCQICFERPRSVRFLPCKHATFCRDCYDSVVVRSSRQSKGITCNVCSTKVESVDDRVYDATYSSTEFAGQGHQERIMAPTWAQELGSGRRLSSSLPMYDMTGDQDDVPGAVPKSPSSFPANANGAVMPPLPPPPPLPPGPPPPPLPEGANLAQDASVR